MGTRTWLQGNINETQDGRGWVGWYPQLRVGLLGPLVQLAQLIPLVNQQHRSPATFISHHAVTCSHVCLLLEFVPVVAVEDHDGPVPAP